MHVRDLCDYIAGGSSARRGEKVEHRGSVNLLNVEHDEQVQEIADLVEVARRSACPVQHWIFSWRDGEQPTAAQADEAVRLLLAEMDLGEHQAFYALHRDTDNWHLHVAINRVHPVTEKLVTVNGGFDLEVAHRALARIEHAQGWAPERQGRYRVNAVGAVERASLTRGPSAQPRVRARDAETRSGEKSAQRVAIEEAGPVLRRARTWQEAHQTLAEKGMRVEAKGSGAVVWVGLIAVKGSAVGRDCSMAALERRLGKYERQMGPLKVREGKPRVLCETVPGWSIYDQERKRHRADRLAEQGRLRAKHVTEIAEMRRQHRGERLRISDRDWRGKGQMLNAIRRLIAAESSKHRAALQDRQRSERSELQRRFGRFPDYEDWLRGRGGHELAHRWRHREGLTHERPRESPQGSAVHASGGDSVQQVRAAYERHLAELSRQGGATRRDVSRIDVEVAIRMRVTGHGRRDIQQAIEEVAPRIRLGEQRDWQEYARRTVATAFGVPGNQHIGRLGPSRARWLRVEGRSPDQCRAHQSDPESERDK